MPTLTLMQWLAIVAFSGMLTGIATWITHRLGMLDVPAERHSHILPTPRGGGAGIVATVMIFTVLQPGWSITMPFWMYCFLPGFVTLSLLGWWDDRVSLPALVRFPVQVLVSLYLLTCIHFHGLVVPLWASVVAGIYLLWMINLYNFMDGSNGMAGFQGVFAGLLLAWLFHGAGDGDAVRASLLLAGACAGFLPWNLGKAKVFMGDVASGSLGFAFAALLIYGVFKGALAVPVAWMVMLVFMCDSTLTLLARVLNGERWYNPHKQHLYQRLIAGGWSHGSVLLLYQVINLMLVAPAIAVAVNYPASAMTMALGMTLLLGLSWLLVAQKIGVLAQAG